MDAFAESEGNKPGRTANQLRANAKAHFSAGRTPLVMWRGLAAQRARAASMRVRAAWTVPAAHRLFSTPPPRPNLPVHVPDADESDYVVYNRPQRKQRKPLYRRPLMYVLAAVPLFTAYLGYWQLQRLKWKVGLIEELEDKLSQQPLLLPRNIKYVSAAYQSQRAARV